MIKEESISFYSIVPIFNHATIDTEFIHKGNYKNAQFSISFKAYAQGKEGFEELVKNAHESIHSKLSSIHLHPNHKASPTNNFLIIEVTYPYEKEYEVAGNTKDTNIITSCILTALRLHSSTGLLHHNTYSFRKPPIPDRGCIIINSPLMPQFIFSHLGTGTSNLPFAEYDKCKDTFDILLKNYEDDTSFDRMLKLALAYHYTSFNLEIIEHSYLILMVIFESLFKEEQERNAEKASYRISKLISSTPTEQVSIKEEFYNPGKNDSLCKIRNYIAHGDASLNHTDLENKYPILYQYITKSIIKLISIPDSEFNKSNDYHTELNHYLYSPF